MLESYFKAVIYAESHGTLVSDIPVRNEQGYGSSMLYISKNSAPEQANEKKLSTLTKADTRSE